MSEPDFKALLERILQKAGSSERLILSTGDTKPAAAFSRIEKIIRACCDFRPVRPGK